MSMDVEVTSMGGMPVSRSVTVLGTGMMGAGMVRSLLRAGLSVTVWNRSPDKAQPLERDGATVAASATSAVAGADVVLTMLFDADATDEVMRTALPAMSADAVWLQCGTVGLSGATQLAELAEAHQIGYLDAPVLGTRQPAENGKLIALVGGPERLRAAVEPVLDAISARVVWVGPNPGDGHRLKLVANSWVLSVTSATAQAIGFARGLGLDPQLFLDAIAGGPLDSGYAQAKGKAMIEGDFAPAFALAGAHKDATLIAEAMGEAKTDATLMRALGELFGRAAANGHGDADMSAVLHAIEGT